MKQLIINHDEMIFDKFDDEYIFVNMETGKYFSIKGQSGVVINKLEEGITLEEIIALFEPTEDHDKAYIKENVHHFIDTLGKLNIVIERNKPEAEEHKTSETKTPFVPLEIEAYVDMEEVIKIDPIHNAATLDNIHKKDGNKEE